jgi:uncharacterized protein
MSEEEARAAVVARLMEKARDALAAARRELDAGDAALASNRVYYACFYALSAVLLKEGLQFAKHTGVRGAMHQHLVRTGRLSADFGRFYDKAFAERQEADYNAMASFTPESVLQRIGDAERFVAEMGRILGS